MAVSVVTDTVACLPPDITEKYRIAVVPMEIVYRGKTYKDGIDMTPSEFYGLLETSSTFPTTSAPSPQAILDVSEKLAGEGNEVLMICASKKLTHVYESAVMARKLLLEKLPGAHMEVLDCGTAAGAQGFVVMDAAEEAMKDGKTLTDAVGAAQNSMHGMHVVVFLDTIDYLARSGRVPYLLAWANSILKIKPIVELLPMGKGVVPVGRARTRQQALNRVVEILEKRAGDTKIRVVVQHTNCLVEAEVLAGLIKLRLDCSDVLIRDFTPVMGVHTGPGLLGVSYGTMDTPD